MGDQPDAEWQNVLDRAYTEQTIAGDGRNLVVISPHQNNFEMPVTVEVWNGPPMSDAEGWQQVVFGDLEIGPRGELTLESPTTPPPLPVRVEQGRYRAEVSGRGFVARGWPGSATPDDSWRIRLWPLASETEAPPPPRTWP